MQSKPSAGADNDVNSLTTRRMTWVFKQKERRRLLGRVALHTPAVAALSAHTVGTKLTDSICFFLVTCI